jgi:hypothetical protein
LFYYTIILIVTTAIMKVLEKYECHPLYKFSKELDHPGFDSRGGQESVLFIKMSCPSMREMRPLNWGTGFIPGGKSDDV